MKLYGNIIGNPVPRPNWNQTNSAAADFIENKPDIAAIEEMARNALPKTGGDVLGNLAVGKTDDTAQRSLYVRRSINDSARSFRIYWGNGDVLRADAGYGGTVENYMELRADRTVFKQAITIESGGTGATNAVDALENLGGLRKSGGTMTGAINMGSKRITDLPTPTSETPDSDAATKGYVDSKRITGDCILYADQWAADGTQTKTSNRVYATDMPHWGVVYRDNKEAEKEAFALVDELETQDGAFVFRCFGEVPKINLKIQWEVHR